MNLATTGPDFLSVSGGTTASSAFRLPYSYEATAAVERQIGSSISARALYVYTTTKRDLQIINALRPYSAYNLSISRQDPGADGVLGTADDGAMSLCTITTRRFAGLSSSATSMRTVTAHTTITITRWRSD